MFEILKIVFILFILLVLIRKKVDLGLVLLLGTLLFGFLFKLDFKTFTKNFFQVLISGETVNLVGIVLMVIYLSNLLQKRGNFQTMVDSLRKIVPEPRLILVLPSVFIGLLPMLGGALVSAPMVNEAGNRWNLSGEKKTFLNYWFRHIWEYCWPLYVNILLASAILDVSVKRITLVQFPFTILAVIVGLIWLFKNVPQLPQIEERGRILPNLITIIISIWPIVLVILSIFLLRFSMLFSLGITVVLTQILYRYRLKERLKMIIGSIPIKTVGLIVSVMVFKRILEISGAVNSITDAFSPEGASGFLLLFTVPFLLGYLTGMNHAYVGISFPILLPVFGAGNPDLILVMFAYVSGFIGILLSPAHLCLFLTLDYFDTELRDVYKILILPCMIILVCAFLILLFLRII